MKEQAKRVLLFLEIGSITLIVAFSIFPIISVAYPQTTPCPDTWESSTPMLTPRAQLGVAVVNGKIYAIGGSANDPAAGPILLNVTEEFDPSMNVWTTKTAMPTSRHSFGIAVYENKIYCIGGSTNGQSLAVNEVYDPASDTWETRNPMPTARAAVSANVVKGRIYLMGGDSANDKNEVYDPATDSWTTESAIPLGVSYSESAVFSNRIYMFGSVSDRSATQIYDPETDMWAFGAPVPTGVIEGAAVAVIGVNAPERIYVLGGEATLNRNGHSFANVTDLNQVYDPERNSWTIGHQLPTQLRFFGSANVNDTLFAIGGFPARIDFLGTNYLYTPIGYGNTKEEPSNPSNYYFVAVIVVSVSASTIAAILVHRKRCGQATAEKRKNPLLSVESFKNSPAYVLFFF